MNFESNGNNANLYGTIWSGDASYIVRELNAFLRGKTEVNIHLHTPGGSVLDGNLIYNALKNTTAKVHIIIDGMAASMGSILMMAGDRVSMAENAFVMIHAPSGYVEGTADDMKNASVLLEAMEKNFVKVYKNRTGKSEKIVKGWLKGENWFDADTALANGLIDEVISPLMEDIDMNAVKEMSLVALASSFEETYASIRTQKNQKSDMKLNAKSRTFLGLTEKATEDQVNAAILKAETENTRLRELNEKQNKARIKALIDPAVAEGRITSKEREEWETLAKSNFELAEKSIAKLPSKESLPVGAQKGNAQSSVDERKDWTFTDWSRKDTSGLLAMKENEPDKYKELAKKSGINI